MFFFLELLVFEKKVTKNVKKGKGKRVHDGAAIINTGGLGESDDHPQILCFL